MLLIVPSYKLWFSFPHSGILYIASSARESGEKIELIDGEIISQKKLFQQIIKKAPSHDIIALTVSIAHVTSAMEISKFIRQNFPYKKIVWGGPYLSSQPETASEEIADIVVIGEGEKQIVSICKGEKLSNIPSIAYFENGHMKINPRKGYIQNLDDLPFPAYDLINFNDYLHPGLKPLAQIHSSRGCPYNCINCTKSIHGNLYRVRSPENVVEEISLLIDKYAVREIHFWDDNLTFNINRVKEICSLILSRNIHKKVRFAVPAGIRADIYDKEMFTLMKKANFYLFAIAVESGEQRIINQIRKNLDLKKVPENLRKLQEHGFRLMLYFMMGFPFESEKDLAKTAKFASSLAGHHANFFAVTPLPGSKLFEIWNKIPDFKNYLKINYDNPIPQARSHEESKILKKYIRSAYFKFYVNPRRLLSTISLMLREGSLFNDMYFLFRSLFKLCFWGHK